MPDPGRAHDRAILDALEAIAPVPFAGTVWRIAREGRDATQGSAAQGRWTPGGVEVLYTSLERDGALAEIGFRLSLEPVWPSRIRHQIHRLSVRCGRTLRFATVASLGPLGVDGARFETFDYVATQALAGAAHFLEFDGLLVPSARHASTNLVLFMDRVVPGSLEIGTTDIVDWAAWRTSTAR